MIYKVRVTPNSKVRRVVEKKSGWKEEAFLKVALTQPPRNGYANKELIETLATFFGVHKNQIKIIKGFRSKNKLVKVQDE